VIAENQPVVFCETMVVYTSSVKNKSKTVLKEIRDREINTEQPLSQKDLKQTTLGNYFEWINKFKLHKTHTQPATGFSSNPLGFRDIKAPCSTKITHIIYKR